jgi:hypothetical protein
MGALGNSISRSSPQNPLRFPILAFAGAATIFYSLITLRMSYFRESDFKKHCGDQNIKRTGTSSTAIQPQWKKIVGGIATGITLQC